MKTEKIELMGLPCTGKSHYTQQLVSQGTYKEVFIRGRAERMFFAILFSLMHPIIFWYFLYCVFVQDRQVKYKQVKPRLLKHKLFFIYANACAREAKSILYKKAVIDEGLYQFIFSLYEVEVTAEDVKKDVALLAKLKRNIFFLRAPGVVREERCRRRGSYVRGGFDKDYVSHYNKIFTKNEGAIVAHLKGISGIEFVNYA